MPLLFLALNVSFVLPLCWGAFMVPEFVVDDGKGNRFYIIDPELSGAGIS